MGETALADETTARLFAALVRGKRLLAGYVLLAVAVMVAILSGTVLGLAFAACFVAVFGTLLWGKEELVLRVLWWPPAMRRLLATQPWRAMPVMVLQRRGTVLALPDGAHVRVYGLSAAGCEVVIRARRVWLVGPDDAGWLAVRVDGLHTPLPARLVRARHAPAAGPNGLVIVTAWVENVRTAMRLGVVAMALVVPGAVSNILSGGRWWSYPVLAMVLFSGGVQLWVSLRFRRLRHTGPWVRSEVVATEWESRWDGSASGTVTVRFPDGKLFDARIDRAPVDLFVDARQEKVLWGTADGVVGFPYYPVAARATFTPVAADQQRKLTLAS